MTDLGEETQHGANFQEVLSPYFRPGGERTAAGWRLGLWVSRAASVVLVRLPVTVARATVEA